MLQALEQRLRNSVQITGVDLTLLGENQAALRICTLSFSNGTVHLQQKQKATIQRKDLKPEVIGSSPFVLCINGAGVLHKKFESNNAGDSLEELLASLLPSIKPADFYIQRSGQERGFISLIRKQALDELMEPWLSSNSVPLGVTLGPLSIEAIIPYVQQSGLADTSHISGGNYNLEVSDGKVIGINSQLIPDEAVVNIGEEVLPVEYLFAYSVAFSYLVQGRLEPQLYLEKLNEARREAFFKKFFERGKWVALLGIFLLLLINFFLFTDLQQRNQAASIQLGFTSAARKQVDSLRHELAKREDVRHSLEQRNSHLSYYLDRIASTVPGRVTLVELSINPVDQKALRGKKQYEFADRTISVRGYTADVGILNEWVQRIKKLDWINGVSGQSFQVDPEKNRGNFSFQVSLKSLQFDD